MISNSTPIICLSKLNRLDLLNKVYGKITIPQSVEREILIKEKPGYYQIQNALKKKWLLVEKPRSKKDFGLHEGENQAINLALEKRQTLLLDDYAATMTAKALGIKTERTTTAIFKALSKKIISKKQTITLLNKLIENGYYIAPPEYTALLTKLSQTK